MKILIINKDTKAEKILPQVNLIEDIEATKKAIKKQLIDSIINYPESLKAYKNLEIQQIAELDDYFNIKKSEHKKLFSYEELLNEIIDDLTKENDKK